MKDVREQIERETLPERDCSVLCIRLGAEVADLVTVLPWQALLWPLIDGIGPACRYCSRYDITNSFQAL